MATILTSTAEWMPVVRILLGINDIELPDTTLNNTLMLDVAESRVKRLLPAWATFLVSQPSNVKMAAIYFFAAMWTDYCKENVLLEQREATFQAIRGKTDWDGLHAHLVRMGFTQLQECDPSTSFGGPAVAIVSPSTPMFEEL